VIQLATLGAARIMHHDAERGSVAVGKLADLVLVDGAIDSAERSATSAGTSLVVKTGSSTARLSCTGRRESGRRQPDVSS